MDVCCLLEGRAEGRGVDAAMFLLGGLTIEDSQETHPARIEKLTSG